MASVFVTEEQLEKAFEWYKENSEHVTELANSTRTAHPPIENPGEPKKWKAENWAWWLWVHQKGDLK